MSYTDNIKTAIIYTRVSTDEQAEYGFSLPHQKEAIEKYCEMNEIRIIKQYQEEFSGKDFNRPAFKELFEYAKDNKKDVDALIFSRWDRFSRNLEEALKYKRLFNNMGIEIMSIDQSIDPTVPESKMMLAVLNVMAEIERDKISIRTKEGMRRAMKEGYWVTTPPFGYSISSYNGSTRKIIIPNEKSEVVKEMFREYSKGTYTVEELRIHFKKKGIDRSYQGYIDLLINIAYIGKISIKPWKHEESQEVRGLHEPIIEEDMFYRVQELLGKRRWKKDPSVNRTIDLPLRGHLKCKLCGRNLTGSKNRSQNGTLYTYYHCQDKCKERFRGDKAHEDFIQFLSSIKISKATKEAYIKVMMDIFKERESDRKNEVSFLENEMKKVRSMIDSVEDKYFQNLIDDNTRQRAMEKYQGELKDLEKQLKDKKKQVSNFEKYLKSTLTLIESLDQYYIKGSVQEKQKLVAMLFPENLVYAGGGYRVSTENYFLNTMVKNIRDYERTGDKKVCRNNNLSKVAPLLSNV